MTTDVGGLENPPSTLEGKKPIGTMKELLVIVSLLALATVGCSEPSEPEDAVILEWIPGTTVEEAKALCQSRLIARMTQLGRPYEAGAKGMAAEMFSEADISTPEVGLPLGISNELYSTWLLGASVGCWVVPALDESERLTFLRAPAAAVPQWVIGTTVDEAKALCQDRLAVRLRYMGELIGEPVSTSQSYEVADAYCGLEDRMGNIIGPVSVPEGVTEELYWVWVTGTLFGIWTGPIQ